MLSCDCDIVNVSGVRSGFTLRVVEKRANVALPSPTAPVSAGKRPRDTGDQLSSSVRRFCGEVGGPDLYWWLAWLGNGVVILVLTKQLQALQAQDFLTLNLAISDAGIAMFGYSRGILEVFNIFGDNEYLLQTFWTCQVDGFIILLFGLISINTLTAISIVRYMKGCQPQHGKARVRSTGARPGSLCPTSSMSSSSSWSTSPCPSLSSCSPVSIIRTVNATHKSSHGEVSERQRKIEKAITKISLLMCAAFLLAWSLYAAISVWSALGCAVPPLLTGLLATLSAKSASFYNPLIYVGLSSKFGSDLSGGGRGGRVGDSGVDTWRISIGDSVPPAMEVSVGGEEEERHGGGGKQEMGQQETDCAQSCVLLNILP
ncbi:hypothetical protein ACEWY4_005468 [Coilia grayii]|uniref:G-protein coupled receptors family 1 profile domain-containing protein n=1 Tax=Coilia grayii TaxID=363190 RepID=A0ABD1KJD2_9TELE